MVSDTRRVAWDTCVIIDAIQGKEAEGNFWPEIEPMYTDAEKGKLEIVVSEISVAEACRINKLLDGGKTHDEVENMLVQFFNNPFILRRPADRRECRKAARLIRDSRLEACDAIIAATALIHGADTLFTRDGCGKKYRKKQNKLIAFDGKFGTPTMAIEAPNAAKYLKADLYNQENVDD